MFARRVWPARPALSRPFDDLVRLRRQMLQLFEGLNGEEVPGLPTAGAFPPINVTQDDDHFYVRAEVPGIGPEALSISALRNRLSISGKREIPAENERVSYHRRERAEGSFSRTVSLPTEVDADRVEARCRNGVLTITLPKAAAARPRQIVVSA
jgi:HSP20 family protein